MNFRLRAALIALGVVGCVGCVDAPPRAIVHVSPGTAILGRAVLVMPTRCESALGAMYCVPATYVTDAVRVGSPPSYAPLIDPLLRLKLEFSGYTLAEAAVMMVTTRDRIDTRTTMSSNDQLPRATTTTAATPAVTLADLAEPEIVEVARSLSLAGIITSQLRVSSGQHGSAQFSLTVTLRELDRLEPVWSVTCSELFLENYATSKRLSNCVGNGVLAVYAPSNLMSRAL